MGTAVDALGGVGAITAVIALAAGGIPTEPPALVGVGFGLFVGGLGAGRAVGYAIDAYGPRRRLRNRRCQKISYERACGALGVVLGAVIYAAMVAIALL